MKSHTSFSEKYFLSSPRKFIFIFHSYRLLPPTTVCPVYHLYYNYYTYVFTFYLLQNTINSFRTEVLRLVRTVCKYSDSLLPNTWYDCHSSTLFKLVIALWPEPPLYWTLNNQRVMGPIPNPCHADCGKMCKKWQWGFLSYYMSINQS